MQTKRKTTFSPSFSTRRLFPSVNHLNCMELHHRHNNSSDLSRTWTWSASSSLPLGSSSSSPHTHTLQIWGDRLHFLLCRWFWKLGVSAVEEIPWQHADQTHCLVTGDFPAQNWSGFSNRSRAKEKCAVSSWSTFYISLLIKIHFDVAIKFLSNIVGDNNQNL